MKYIMGHKRATPQLAPCNITESIAISVMRKVRLTSRADVEDMDGVNADKLFEVMEIEFENIMQKFENIGNIEDRINVAEYIRNVGEEQFANIRDEVFEVFDEMEVNFENIMDQEWMVSWTKKCYPTIVDVLVI